MNPTNNLALDAWQTTLAAAIANTLASSTAMAAHLNDELKRSYDQRFESWKVMVLAGKIDNTNPPRVPFGYKLETNSDGFSFPALGSNLVCEPRTDIPADYSKPQVQSLPEPEYVRNVAKGDTLPVGYVMTDEKGNRWQKQQSVTPFGLAQYWARL